MEYVLGIGSRKGLYKFHLSKNYQYTFHEQDSVNVNVKREYIMQPALTWHSTALIWQS